MNRRTSVVSISGDYEETITQLARHLGSSKIRRAIFDAVYGRGSRPRSKKQIMQAAGIKDTGANAQQAQNELDHLYRHHLIVRHDNDGAVRDGSRYLYGKDDEVRANRERISRYADNRKFADSVPTKRRPAIRALKGVPAFKAVTRSALKKRKQLVVLYLSASPDSGAPLRVDAEMRLVQEAVRGTLFRDNVKIVYRPAADLGSLLDGLNDHHPQIVHFSGHGDATGLATDNGRVDKPGARDLPFVLLAEAIGATDTPPQLVVLNACESSSAKKELLRKIKILISMKTSISDLAAAAFASRFYTALASGQSVRKSFDQAKVAVAAVSIGEFDTPEISLASGVNAGKIVLA